MHSGELIFRFLFGGLIVSLFALLGDGLRPKSFAGLFGAAPSIALATLGLTVHKHGPHYAALEARSMIFASLAFLFYAACCAWILRRFRPSTLLATLSLLPAWLLLSLSSLLLLD